MRTFRKTISLSLMVKPLCTLINAPLINEAPLEHKNEELSDLPCIFCYYNFDHEVAETELITEYWLLVKGI